MRITKGTEKDIVDAFDDADELIASMPFPKKGPFPHDATHLIVERVLGFEQAFWGRVFAGESPEQVVESAKTGGHMSASRAELADPQIVELVQAERIVECFEAEIWGGATDNATFSATVRAGCAQSKVPDPHLDDASIAAIRGLLGAAVASWNQLPCGAAMELDWS